MQRTEEEFKKESGVIIYNDEDFEVTKKQIDEKLGDHLWRN